ncbi:MAG TPA: sigma-54 dependent transcriptional regulator [Thermodesulfobacteriota bacterium]|nr:sigma-54 dependent transcriptional regulator [Thermodesulfobacteriota bacterium]
MAERLLIVEDETTLSASLKRVFMREGYEVETFVSAEDALKDLDQTPYDVILSDILLPGINGIEFLQEVKKRFPESMVVIMTAYASIETAIGALRAGAFDYILKPIIHEEIKRIVRKALNFQSLHNENQRLKKQIGARYDFEHIVGQSVEIQQVIQEVKKFSDSKSNILVLGESGTGKELFTRAIHHNSPRRDKPFIPINCSAIPDNLLESELFGYVKGAFTGAVHSKRGLFEEADGGLVFLDEIADLNPPLQAKLLRVIDDHEIRPLGSTHSRKVDLRFVAATNKNILKAVQEGSLREDLYYRLAVVTLTLPPLRDRQEDILLLAEHFLNKYSKEIRKPVKGIHESGKKILQNYGWPGNVRELQNIIERAVLLADGEMILPEHLPEGLYSHPSFMTEALDASLSIENYTKEFILRYQEDLSEQQLAERLGITRKSLWEKRKKWGLLKRSPLPPRLQTGNRVHRWGRLLRK